MTIPETRPGRLARLVGALARRPSSRARPGQSALLDDLNDHYLRDIGIRRERSASPRRCDPWM